MAAVKPTIELVLERIHPDDRAFMRQAIDAASRGAKDFNVTHRLLMPSGVVKHVHVVGQVTDHEERRMSGLADHFEVAMPGGAFYAFPKAPWGSGSEFVARAIENELLVIPGNIFSRADTHFRISYAAGDDTIRRGIEVLRKIAQAGN